MPSQSIRIGRLQPEDVPAVAKFTGEAFKSDRQTQMKALGREDPFDMAKYTLESMPSHLQSPTCHVLKAVDAETGEIMGVCNWGIRGFVPKTLPYFEERVAAAREQESNAQENKAREERAEEETEKKPQQAPAETDPIKRLESLTNADMNAWMSEVMPPGTKCLFIIGLTVAPQFQGRGVGAALLRWGTQVCDDNGVFAWVHSSDPAWGMYRKSGFEVVRSLDINLDEYAPCKPPGEGPDAIWGHYVFRYMKYFPK